MTLTYTTIKFIHWCALKPLVPGVRPLDPCIRFAPVQVAPCPQSGLMEYAGLIGF